MTDSGLGEAKPLGAPAEALSAQTSSAYNWLAIVSLVLLPLTCGFVGVFFGIAALVAVRRGRATNRVLAIWAVSLNTAAAVVSVVLAVVVGSMLWNTGPTQVHNPWGLEQGDCVAEPVSLTSTRVLEVVPCAEPHWGQIYSAGLLTRRGSSVDTTHRRNAQRECLNILDKMDELETVAEPDNVRASVMTRGLGRHVTVYYVCVLVGEDPPLPEP